jgi:transglutaminase-like putative cysteine protease
VTNRLGVCTEYARLYDGLARLAGIPSFVIDGAACDEKEKCQGHSWNMIFYGGRWIEVDPTWNLMSGAVSSSHVYINDNGQGEVEIKYRSDAGKVNIEMGIDMSRAE